MQIKVAKIEKKSIHEINTGRDYITSMCANRFYSHRYIILS